MKDQYDLEVFETQNGKFPFIEWESRLDKKDRGIITTRLARIRSGNFGDCKPIKGKGLEGVYELRIHFGPGYRVYFGVIGKKIILILVGGDKRSQEKDIEKAKKFWGNYLNSNQGGL